MILVLTSSTTTERVSQISGRFDEAISTDDEELEEEKNATVVEAPEFRVLPPLEATTGVGPFAVVGVVAVFDEEKATLVNLRACCREESKDRLILRCWISSARPRESKTENFGPRKTPSSRCVEAF